MRIAPQCRPDSAASTARAVRALPVDGIVAWVSDVERGVPVSIDGVRAHDAVVEAALETGATPVPARFGQRFDNDDACRAALASRAASVETLLGDDAGARRDDASSSRRRRGAWSTISSR